MKSNAHLKLFIFLPIILSLLFSCDKDDDSDSCPTTYTGEVVIESQEEFNAFFKCTYKTIEGRLTLRGVNDISALKSLESVHQIRIYKTELINLEGLNNLKTLSGFKNDNTDIPGEIIIGENDELTSLDGLSSLVEIPSIVVNGNSKLYDFCELSGDLVNNISYVVSGNNFNPTRDDLINETVCKSELNIGEKVYEGDVSILPYHNYNGRDGQFTSVENFGKLGYTKINGSLKIAVVSSLEPLIGLNEITGDLKLGYSYQEDGSTLYWGNSFENLKGLDSLKTIGGNLELIDDNYLKRVDELTNLTHIGGNLDLYNNDSLINIDGLINVSHIGGSLAIAWNDSLENIDGLINVTSELNNDFTLFNNRQLKSINGLANAKISSLNSLNLGHLYNLIDFNVFSELTTLNTLSIRAQTNETIYKIGFLRNLNQLDSLIIQYTNNIKNLDWLPVACLASIKNITLKGNSGLENLDALNVITEIEGNIKIENNSSLLNLKGLDALEIVNGDLQINDNEFIVNFEGLGSLKQIKGSFYIHDNNSLINLAGIESLTNISGDLTIEENNSLENLQALNSLKQVEGTFTLFENFNLASLDGLNGLENIGENFYLGVKCELNSYTGENTCYTSYYYKDYNESIQDISALSNLKTIGEKLWLENLSILNLDGLQNLSSVNTLWVHDNPLLTNLDEFSNIESLNQLRISNNTALTSFCGLKNTILPTSSDNFYVGNNAYNPTLELIKTDDGCSN